MSYKISSNYNHFTGKRCMKAKPHKKRVKVKHVHKNKYAVVK